MCFVTDFQRGSLLGSKELGTKVLELQCVMLANHDKNILVQIQAAQSACLCKVGIEYTVGFIV